MWFSDSFLFYSDDEVVYQEENLEFESGFGNIIVVEENLEFESGLPGGES